MVTRGTATGVPGGLHFRKQHTFHKVELGKTVPSGHNIGVGPPAEIVVGSPERGEKRTKHVARVP